MRLTPYVIVVTSPDRDSRAPGVLRSGGYEVTRFDDPTAAARSIALLQPEAVVIDVSPLQAGKVAQQIAAIAPRTPLLVVTGVRTIIDARVLEKAFVASELVAAVDRMLVDATAA